MPVGAAIGIAGIGGALISGNAATAAAQTQANAATQAEQLQLGMFNQVRSDLSPYRDLGTSALTGYKSLLGITDGSGTGTAPGAATGAAAGPAAGSPDWGAYLQANPDVMAAYNAFTPAQRAAEFPTPESYASWHYQHFGQTEGRNLPTVAAAPAAGAAATNPAAAGGIDPNAIGGTAPSSIETALSNLPGYQFTKQQGTQAITNQLAAQGLGGNQSGALGKGLARFVTGLADQTYQQQVNNYAGAVGTGAAAANQTGGYATTTGQGVAGNITAAGNATAAGTVGAANAASAGLNSLSNGYLTSRVLGMYGNPASAGGSYSSYAPGLSDDLQGLT